MKLIIVDDEKSSLYNIIDAIMDDNKIEYKLFNKNLSQLIEYCDNTIDAALIDINMPEFDGRELAQNLIEKNKDIQIVFITGYLDKKIDTIKEKYPNNILGLIYKPYEKIEILNYIDIIKNKNIPKNISFNMFGTFDVFVNDKLINFTCSKSKELLALLVVYNGRTVTKNKVIEHLWPGKEYSKADSLYRNTRYKLAETLKLYNIENLVELSNAKLSLIPNDNIICDYWEILKTKNRDIPENDNVFNDNDIFLREYDWSIEYYN